MIPSLPDGGERADLMHFVDVLLHDELFVLIASALVGALLGWYFQQYGRPSKTAVRADLAAEVTSIADRLAEAAKAFRGDKAPQQDKGGFAGIFEGPAGLMLQKMDGPVALLIARRREIDAKTKWQDGRLCRKDGSALDSTTRLEIDNWTGEAEGVSGDLRSLAASMRL